MNDPDVFMQLIRYLFGGACILSAIAIIWIVLGIFQYNGYFVPKPRITKRGVDPTPLPTPDTTPRTHTCKRCDSTLEYTDKNVYTVREVDTSANGTHYIKCPVCRAKISVKW